MQLSTWTVCKVHLSTIISCTKIMLRVLHCSNRMEHEPSINAVIVHNTIINASNARWCILAVNGSSVLRSTTIS